jgi:LPS sulfotransferase NodH
MINQLGRPSPTHRPDAIDLIGPDYDQLSTQPAERTLIICSAPRTGSYELCRYLLAAGIGVPHEYFNASYASRLGERWGLAQNPLEISELAGYVAALRRRRGQNGIFATKLQFHHFEGSLRNKIGRDLFEGATIVHLFRSDALAQYASFRSALESGTWDFSGRATTSPLMRNPSDSAGFFGEALNELDLLMGQDAGFRRLFTLIGIKPIFVTTAELFERPREVIRKISDVMHLTENSVQLDEAIAVSAAYGRDRTNAVAGLSDYFMSIAFGTTV